MIRKQFNQWAEHHAECLQSLGITTEQVKHGDVDEQLVPDPSIGFVHESEYAIGQVTVWESNQMEYEVVKIETEELILWKYVEKVDDDETSILTGFCTQYFRVLQSGLKP